VSKDQLAQILQVGAQFPPPENGGLSEFRSWFEASNEPTPIPPGARIDRVECGPVTGELIEFDGAAQDSLVVYFHGGGFFFGSSRTHRVVAANLALHSGARVLTPDYRLAPEHPAPTSHHDAYDVYLWALEQGYAPSKISVIGDSAGGNLALATVVRARDEGRLLPAAVVLMSPALDLAGDGGSHRSETDAPLLTAELIALMLQIYVGDGDLRSPELTPFDADLSGLPPVLAHVGSWERLRDDAVTVTERITATGGDATLKVFDGMCHSWQMFAPMLDEGMESIDEAAAFMRARIS
jgi:monoterpene epsilon-lactone hydrolase